jgi:hypothetical protein
MITGYWTSQAIYAAAKLGIADLLADGPRSVDDLARSTRSKPDFLYRVLRALASVGIFSEEPPRRFALTPLAELLRSGVAGSQRSLVLMMGDEHFHVWGNLVDAIQTGDNAFEKVYGLPIFEFLAQNPEKGRTFDEAMTGIHGPETDAVLAAYDFSQIGLLADVGGGNGSTLAGILRRHPAMQGILFDLPHVVARAKAPLEAAGLSSRCRTAGGSFFESVPSGADAYLLRHIIHDWDDEKSLAILRNCRAAIPPGGRLLVVESVIPPGNEHFVGKFLDLTMMLIPGGKERTAEEYRQLYEQAGFRLERIVRTGLEVSVVEGVPR